MAGTWYTRYQTNQQTTQMAAIHTAIAQFETTNGYLPCPANPSVQETNSTFGTAYATCAGPTAGLMEATALPGRPSPVQIGMLPVRALGLDNTYAKNPWGYRYVYAVTEGLTAKATYNEANGGIDIVDGSSLTGTTVLPTAGTALYVLVDPGKDGAGAYTAGAGVQHLACPAATAYEHLNCASVATFRAMPISTQTGNNYFDDVTQYRLHITNPNNITGMIPGYTVFGSLTGGITQDIPGGYFWDVTNHRQGINTATPQQPLEVDSVQGSGNLQLRIGTTGGNYYDIGRRDIDGFLSIQGNQGGANSILLAPNSGNVGIGTTNPIQPLVVSNGGAEGLEFQPVREGANTDAIFAINRSGGSNVSLYMGANAFHFQTPAIDTTDRLTILTNGNVGIGTTAPSQQLEVNGAILADNTILTSGANAGFQAGDRALNNNASVFYRSNNITSLWDNTAGNVISYNSAGNAGVGTTAPAAKLDVNGTLRPGSFVTGQACTPEGSLGYDASAHQPIYCSQALVWTTANSASAYMNRTWHQLGVWSGVNGYSYPVEISAYCTPPGSGGAMIVDVAGNTISQCDSTLRCSGYATVPPGASWQISLISCGVPWEGIWELY